MKLRTILFITTTALLVSSVQAQKKWTLQECIQHAIVNNLTIRKTALEVDNSEIDLDTRKWARLPNLSASAGENLSWGKVTSNDNTYVYDMHNTSTNLGLNTEVPLFTGFELPNQYKLAKLNLKAAIEDLNKAKEDVSVNVATLYIDVLFNMEIFNVAKEQVLLSKQQLARMEKLREVGKAAPAEVAEARARVAQDEMTQVEAENKYNISLLDLSQLLDLPTPQGFAISTLDIEPKFKPLTPPDDIFIDAIAIKPEIKAAEYRLEGSENSIRIAQSGYYPTLSFGARFGSNYNTYNGKGNPFFTQLKDNKATSIGFNLSIPIFNRFATRNRVRTARLQQTNYSIALDQTKKDLYKEIQQAWHNAVAAESKYNTSSVAVAANEESFRLMTEKFENGQATSVEFNEAKLNLMKALSDKIQAKYSYLFRTKILDFYKGIPIQ